MINKMAITILITVGLGLTFATKTLAWFDPSGPYYGKVVITRANTYVTVPDGVELGSTNTLIGTSFFDFGDIDAEITADYGGDPSDTFHVAYPVSIFVYFFTNSASVAEGGGYDIARLQYFEGTDSSTSTNWVDVPGSPITVFDDMLAVEGGHFGLITWTPPNITNTYYLLRVWARLNNGWQSADLSSLNITKDGNGDDWDDYEVLLVKSSPYKKPGARAIQDETSFLSRSNKNKEAQADGWFKRFINKIFGWFFRLLTLLGV